MAKVDWTDNTLDGYRNDGKDKKAYHREARKTLKLVAEALSMPLDSFDVRTNMAGPAVRGETTLHGENIYVQVGSSFGGILVRTCKGRKDYTGGMNNFLPVRLMGSPYDMAAAILPIMQRGK